MDGDSIPHTHPSRFVPEAIIKKYAGSRDPAKMQQFGISCFYFNMFFFTFYRDITDEVLAEIWEKVRAVGSPEGTGSGKGKMLFYRVLEKRRQDLHCPSVVFFRTTIEDAFTGTLSWTKMIQLLRH